MVSIRDVAKRAGVSHQTVSNAINSPEVVSADTRDRIQEAIRELGYKPNASARRLRSGHSDTIAIGISIGENRAPSPIFDAFLHLLAERANELDKQIVLYARKDEDSELAHISALREQSDVDAVVLNELEIGDHRPQWLLDNGQPFVLFGRPWDLPQPIADRIPWVDVNGYAGIKSVTRKLIYQGRRRIGFIGWDTGTGTATDRESGWRDAILESRLAGCDQDLDTWSIGTQESIEAGIEAAYELFSRQDSPDTFPDAIVCASDSLAVGALIGLSRVVERDYILRTNILSLPHAIQRMIVVTGFDDSALSRAYSFPSVHQPLEEVTRLLLDMVVDITTGEKVTADPRWHRLLEPRVVWRARKDMY